jgi:hypothetical protein
MGSLFSFLGLSREKRRIVFYSEGKNYWVHLESLIEEMLISSELSICYISSSADDPGLKRSHKNYKSFEIGEGFIRDWLFQNIDTDVMVMTMPDLHQYQVKKSKHKVHYVYLQHSFVSLHMVYRPGAFDHYDTIFCSGPHHEKESRAMEALGKLPQKKLVAHGYPRLDAIHLESQQRAAEKKECGSGPRHILLAPSWGEKATIESGVGLRIVEDLLQSGYKVTLRPHPQTTKFAAKQVNAIVDKHASNPNFLFEDNVAGQDSLHSSDMMISDWSGAALDYALGLGKPVLFVDVPKKVNNPEYTKIDIIPLEISVREKIGLVVDMDYDRLPIEECLNKSLEYTEIKKMVYNLGRSEKIGAAYLYELLKQLQSNKQAES